ncbi:MAG: ABC transporter substrate-binding protein [Chloroflexi bacterium]|nr:ABC transporter substrate-binding protein [Chloroflexota bacterium]
MKRNIVWLVVSCLMALSLVLASCAPAPTTPTTPTPPAVPAAPTAPTAPTTPTAPKAPAALTAPAAAPTTEVPKYGGVSNIIIRRIANTAPVLVSKSTSINLNLTNEALWGGDWAKGAAGTNEVGFFAFVGSLYFMGPRLATSYERPDPDTLIFHIRKGVHYGLNPNSAASRLVNGRELTADDVVRSMKDWFFDPEGYWFKQRVGPEERPLSIEATDKYTVKMKLQPGTASAVMYYVADFSEIHPPEVYDKYNKMRIPTDVVGTGPFLVTDYVTDSSITFVRNPNYWDTDPVGPGKGQQLPYLDGVKFLMIEDKSTQQAALRTGKTDALVGSGHAALNWDEAELMLQQRPELKYAKYLSRSPNGIGLRIDKPELPWYNKKVRQALTMAVDYNTIIKDYFRGNAALVYPVVPWPEQMPYYTPMAEQNEVVRDMYTYQPEKAKKLLAEAGYPNGFKIEVLAQSTQVDELSIIKEYWAKVGVNLVFDVKERAVFESITNGFQQKEAARSEGNVSVLFAFHHTHPSDSANVARINDPYANKVYEDTRADYMFNEEKLWTMMKDFEKYVIEQAWQIQFPSPYIYHVWWPWLKNYQGQHYLGISTLWYPLKYVWLDQALKKSMGF